MLPHLFAAMRDAGSLPVAAPANARAYLDERRVRLAHRMDAVADKARGGTLEDVCIEGTLKTRR